MTEIPNDVLKIIFTYKTEFEQFELKKKTIEGLCSLLLEIQPAAVPYLKQCLFNLFDLSEPSKLIAMTHRLLGYFNRVNNNTVRQSPFLTFSV